MSRVPSLLTAVLVVLCGIALSVVAVPSRADAAILGLSDQHVASLRDARVAALNLSVARLIVPWDVAYGAAPEVDAWLAAVRALGATPLIAFERRPTDRCPEAPCALPAVAQYQEATRAFRERWPDVKELTAWNEPNHPIQPTSETPVRAAQFHDALRRDCPGCTIVAGDFVDSASMKGYFEDYAAALGAAVQVWGVHNYGDLVYERPSYVEWLLARTTAPLWLTETGGIVALRSTADGSVQLPFSESRAAAGMRQMLTLLAARPDRIARAYAYHWRAIDGAFFDAGLLRADGTERPSYRLFADAAGPRPIAPAGAGSANASGSGGGSGATPTPRPGQPGVGNAPSGSNTGDRDGAARAAGNLSIPGATPAAQTPASTVVAIARAEGVDAAAVVRGVSGSGPRIGRPYLRGRTVRIPVRCPATRNRGCRGAVSVRGARRSGRVLRLLGTTNFAFPNARWHHVAVRLPAAPAAAITLTGAIRVSAPRRVALRTWLPEEIR